MQIYHTEEEEMEGKHDQWKKDKMIQKKEKNQQKLCYKRIVKQRLMDNGFEWRVTTVHVDDPHNSGWTQRAKNR